MAFNLGDIIVTLKANTAGLQAGLQDLQKFSDQASGNVSMLQKGLGVAKVGAIAFAGAAATAGTALIGLGTAGVSSAADFQQSRVAFETMLGSADKARQMMNDISDFAKKTPFELPDVVLGSQRLLSFGVAQEKVIPTFKMLGDIALGNKQKMESLTQMFGKIKAKGTADLEALNIAMDAGVPIIASLAEHFKVTEKTVFDMVSKGKVSLKDMTATMEEMTSEGGMFFGGMDKQSQTFSGVVSNIKDGFGQMLRSMVGLTSGGDVVVGGVFDRVNQAAQKLMPIVQRLAEQIGPFMSRALSQFDYWMKQGQMGLEALGAAFSGEGVTSDGFIGKMEELGVSLRKIWDILVAALGPSLTALWNNVQTNLLPALQRLWDLIEPFIIPTLKVLGVLLGATLVAAIWALSTVLNQWATGLSQLINIIVDLGIITIANFMRMKESFEIVGRFLYETFAESFRKTKEAWQPIFDFFGSILNYISGIAHKIADPIAEAFRGAFETVKEIVKSSFNWIIDKVNGAIDSINKSAGKIPGVPDLGRIPRLATGGIVTRPTVAMIGEGREPEAVIPLSKLGQLEGNKTINFNNTINVESESDVEMLNRKMAFLAAGV